MSQDNNSEGSILDDSEITTSRTEAPAPVVEKSQEAAKRVLIEEEELTTDAASTRESVQPIPKSQDPALNGADTIRRINSNASAKGDSPDGPVSEINDESANETLVDEVSSKPMEKTVPPVKEASATEAASAEQATSLDGQTAQATKASPATATPAATFSDEAPPFEASSTKAPRTRATSTAGKGLIVKALEA